MRRLADLAAAPFVFLAALLLALVRRAGLETLPACRRMLDAAGLLPVRRHYYEPYLDAALLPPEGERAVGGIAWDEPGQLALLDALVPFAPELAALAEGAPAAGDTPGFRFGNGMFEAGDAEFLYAWLRLRRPKRVFEVGSGYSTLVAARALQRNREEGAPAARHVCIEPYEAPWLARVGVELVRRPVERLGTAFFSELGRGDLLFIDSSHVIRPGGDVLFQVLELLPALAPGVTVHLHDIFSPLDYPRAWLAEKRLLWNEQYLVEAFLSGHREWRVAAALALLHRRHFERLRAVCPFVTSASRPGSLYLEKRAA